MNSREQYERTWAGQPPGHPAADPRGPEHQANAPHPEFERLCLIASRRRVDVALTLTRHLAQTGHERQHRRVRAIVLYAGDVKIASERIRGERIDEAASLLMAVLGAGA